MVSLAEEAEAHIKGTQQLEWLRRLEVEQGNIRAALGWLIEQQEAELSLRLGGACWRFWLVRGYFGEGYRWLAAALALPQANPRTAPRAKALCGAGWLSSFLQGDAVSTRALLEESAALFGELGDQGGRSEALSELAEGVFWHVDTTVARALFEECVALARGAGDPWHLAMALRTLGWFLSEHAPEETERMVRLLEESIALSRDRGDAVGLSRALRTFTRVELVQGHVERAAALAQENLTVARQVDSATDLLEVLNVAAIATLSQGDAMQAVDLLEECLARARALGDTYHSKDASVLAQLTLGGIALHQDHLERATTLLEQSLDLARAVGWQDRVALALGALGAARRAQGDLAQARALCTEGVALAKDIGSHMGVGKNLLGLACIAADAGHLQQAARLFAAATSWMPLSVALDPFERADYERTVAQVREHLGEAAFTLAWAQGQTFTPEDALAAGGLAPAATPPSRTQSRATTPHGLTEREVEVLRLVAQGLTNARIAEHLVLSRHTVGNHVRAILSKLDVSSRSGATRFAVEHHLV
jgi:DNA-binding CsgD family transcriptional regulator/tetratricopeptide (TPR) repeat protein